VQGTIELREAAGAVFRAAELNELICPEDTIRVGPRSRGEIAFLETETVLRLDEDTTLQIHEPPEEGRSLLEVIRGVVYFFSRVPRTLEVRTPFVNAAVEGTEFVVEVAEGGTSVTVLEGVVSLANERGALTLASSEAAVVAVGEAPELRVVVRPRDAVRWALYYEPVLPVESVERLEQVPEAERDALFYVRRAGSLLSVGRIDEARSDIDRALELSPESGEAYALRAVIAVAQNDKEGALSSAREAVTRSPESAAAKIALSYAQQASFDLEAARATLYCRRSKTSPTTALPGPVSPSSGSPWDTSGELWRRRRGPPLWPPIWGARTRSTASPS
jgi:ferric-dicitrate binding protein FerR (iron transport regulator)